MIKPERPVNSQDQRAEVLASLEMVDYVTIFDEETVRIDQINTA